MNPTQNITADITTDETGGAIITLKLCPVSHKSLQHVTKNIPGWISDVVSNRAHHEGIVVYKRELQRHLNENTLESDMTIETLILNSVLNNTEPEPEPEPEEEK